MLKASDGDMQRIIGDPSTGQSLAKLAKLVQVKGERQKPPPIVQHTFVPAGASQLDGLLSSHASGPLKHLDLSLDAAPTPSNSRPAALGMCPVSCLDQVPSLPL